jgi:hypothetical protein
MSDEKFPQWVINLIDQAGEKAFEVMVEQHRINPDAIKALYGDPNDYH